MTEMVNPYIAGAPVVETRMFFGREDVFNWIQNSLTGQYANHTLVIHGQRRVGKTSVLKQLGNRLPKKYIPVFFDLQGRTHTTLDRFLWWLAREIVRVLKQERDITFPVPERETFSQDIEFFEHRFLPDLRTVLGENVLLLTFDEFDNLEESEIKEELSIPLIDYLRRLMGQEGLNFIFSIGSSGRKLENMQASYTEFFKTALYKKISFLSREQSTKLITNPVEGLLNYESKAVSRIFDITSGHPYFTQLICHELFSGCQQTGDLSIQEKDVEAVLEDVVERGTVNLKFVWDEASDIEKWSLASLSQLEGKVDTPALTNFLRKQRFRFSESDLTSGLLRLREKDILTEENRFVIYLLKLWLKKNRPIEQVREELTEVNPIANRYIEIGMELHDGGQFEKAIENFREALAVSPANIQAQVNIALVYMGQKAYNKAIIEFEKALAMDDEEVSARSGLCEAHLALGDAAMAKGRTKEAVLSYQRVLAINTEHTDARGRMAELSRQRADKALAEGKDEEALSAFTEALKFTPEDPILITRVEKVRVEKNSKVLSAQIARSEKEVATRSWDKAIASLTEALEISPGDPSILKMIRGIKERQLQERLDSILAKVETAELAHRWDTAIAGLNEYLRLKPDDIAIQERMSNLMVAKHTAWLQAITLRVDQAVLTQNWDEALAALNEALQLEPDNTEMLFKTGEVHTARRLAKLNSLLQQADQAADTGLWDKAIDILNNGLASNPDNELLIKKLAEARGAKRAVRLQAALRLADTSLQAGRWDAAAASLQEVLANEPENPEFLEKLAKIKKLEHDTALKTLQIQVQGLVFEERFEEALQVWQDHLSLNPADSKLVEAETTQIKKEHELIELYSNANQSLTGRDFDQAINLLKNIILLDENYKDASRLLTKAIELRRTAPGQRQSKTRKMPEQLQQLRSRPRNKSSSRRFFAAGILSAILVVGIGGGLFWLGKNYLPALPGDFANPTTTPTTAPIVIITPTPQGKTIIVTSAEDNGQGTLRQALNDAQMGDTITFDPEFFPPGSPTTIFLTTETLPSISQGGIMLDASNTGVILDGSKFQTDNMGLIINSDHNTVMGLHIINFRGIGIYLEGGSFNRIGGDPNIGIGPLGQGNLLSNNAVGISLLSSCGGNSIIGNLIGTNVDLGPLGNQKSGIWIEDNLSFNPVPNMIGPGNIIAYNGSIGSVQGGEITGGIVIDDLDNVVNPTNITANSIFNNSGPGILYYDKSNGSIELNYATPPIILDVNLEAGIVNGQTCENCDVEIFSTDTRDGKIYEGAVTADEVGNFSFSKGDAFTGPFLTATARSIGKNTSEFSLPSPRLTWVTDFADPILAAIAGHTPNVQDNCDTPLSSAQEWIDISTVSKLDGECNPKGNFFDLINWYTDFVIEMDARFLTGINARWDFYCRGYQGGFSFKNDGTVIVDQEQGIILYDAMLPGLSDNHVLIIVKDAAIGLYVNGQPAYYRIMPQFNGFKSGMVSWGGGASVAFDNITIWDLNDIQHQP
jgi:tetratricopeptide (TPR) repeat protein